MLTQIVDTLNAIIWSQWLVFLCLGTGTYFSMRSRFLQVRLSKDMVRLLLDTNDSEKGLSSFQALSMSLAARVGTGNIVGVATAIAFGGPGAIFWMWLLAFLGAGSAFAESTLAQLYKEEQDGEYRGGAAFYIEKALGNKPLAAVYAVITIITMGIFLSALQSNSIAAAFDTSFGISKYTSGLFVSIIIAIVIFGGVKRIGKVAELVVPFMALGYILVALIIILVHWKDVPSAFNLIFTSAFGLEPAFAGILGSTVAWGVKRGVFSNEAGMGSATSASASAEVSHPAKQGLVQGFSVYIDTLFVCTATALMIIVTNSYTVTNEVTGEVIQNFNFMQGVEPGVDYTIAAVSTVFTNYGADFIAIAMFFFAFTSILGNYYMSETNIAYLTKNSKNKHIILNGFRAFVVISLFIAAPTSANVVWAMGDVGFGSMAWINLIVILLLSGTVFKVLKDYESQRKEGKDPVFNSKKLGIENATFWEK